jgi:lysophospholipase
MPEQPRLFLGEIANTQCDFFTLPDGGHLRFAVVDPRESARGTFLIAPGRREFIEKKYTELGPELLSRGYRLIFFDWRGQGFSSRFLPGEHYQRDHVVSMDLYLNDLRAFYTGAVQPRLVGPLFVTGHSMGGLHVLRWLAEDRPTVKGAFVTSPMLALGLPRFLEKLCGAVVKLGFGEAYAPWQHDYNDGDRRFRGNVLSQDPLRFAVMEKYFNAQPEMMVGGVSWSWLYAALKSIVAAQKPGYLDRIETPTLVLVGSKDIVTPPSAFRRLFKSLSQIEDHTILGAKHDLMNELEFYRRQAWERIDRFLARVKGT